MNVRIRRALLASALLCATLAPVAPAAARPPAPPPPADPAPTVGRVVRLTVPTRWDAWASRRSTADVEAAARRIDRSLDAVAAAVAAAGGDVVSRYDSVLAGALVHLPADRAAAAQRALLRLPDVAAVDRAPLATAMDLGRPPDGAAAGPRPRDPLLGAARGDDSDRPARAGAARAGAAATADAAPSTGAGMTIAVIDTGVDYTHAAFGGPGTLLAYAAAELAPSRIDDVWDGHALFPTARIVGGWDAAGESYAPGCGAAAEAKGLCARRPAPDADPFDRHGHGTHVAGIAAGGATPYVPGGVAPGADVLAVKIFGAGAQTDLLIDGLEWALEANLSAAMRGARRPIDVVNLSLGIAYGAKVLGEAGTIQRLVDSGALVVASAGNDGNLPFIVGAPAIAPDSLAVASHLPSDQHTWDLWLARPGDAAPTVMGSAKVYHQVWSPDPPGDVTERIVPVGRGCPAGADTPADPYAADPAGALGLFVEAWGDGGDTCTATTQSQRLAAAGAVGALFNLKLALTTASRWDGEPRVNIPVWTISDDVADAIRADTARGITVTATLHRVPEPSRDHTPSTFTSRGPGRNGGLKPEISAPGQLILAPYLGTGDRGARFSGTSMAAPAVAGAAALAGAAWRARGIDLGARDLAALLISSADPAALHISPDDPAPPPLSLSGAGAVDAEAAARATTLVRAGRRASIDLGFRALTEAVTMPIAIAITNAATTTLRYSLSPRFRDPADDREAVTFAGADVVARPGETVTATLEARIDPARFIGWPMAGGAYVSDADSLTAVEIDGWCEVGAAPIAPGARAVARMATAGEVAARVPFYLLGRRASALAADWPGARIEDAGAGGGDAPDVRLTNASAFDGTSEWFTLLATDPSEAGLPDKVDLDAVGVRAAPDPEGSGNTIVSFALHSRGVRAHPLETWMAVELDTDLDGTADYRLSTEDEELVRTGAFRSGRVIAWLERADGGGLGITRRYHAAVDLTSRSTVLPLQIEDTGLTPSRLRFQFRVIAQDIVEGDLYRDPLVDIVPDGGGWLMYDGRDPARTFAPLRWTVPVAGHGSATLALTAGAAGAADDPDPAGGLGIGLLGLFPQNAPGPDDVAILAPARAARVYLPWGERPLGEAVR